MPIYEYSCPKCGEFEVTQRITEDPLKKCPTCKSKVRKLISNTSFQLKGSGWYVTDYAGKKGGETKDAKSETGGKDSTAASESKSSSESTSSPATESKEKPKSKKKETAAQAA